jgi:hypothetical protein
MAQTGTKLMQAAAWILVIVSFFLLFVFYSLLGKITNSDLANLLIVGGATLGSTFFLAYCSGLLLGILRVYQKIRADLRFPLSRQLKLLRLEDLPPEFVPTIKNTASTLSPLRFKPIGYVQVAAPGSTFYQGLFPNPRTGAIARCALFVQNDQVDTVLAFQTRFSDGTDRTTSHVSPAYFARLVQAQPKGRSGLVFFDIEDTARLARLHQAAVEREHMVSVETDTLDPIRCQSEAIEREMATQIAAGYLRQEGDEYRATPIGALKMALKIITPVSKIRIRSARRRAERFLAETGL